MSVSPQRLLAELKAVVDRFPAMQLCSSDPPILEGVLDVDGEPRRVRLTLPWSYPSIPPLVHELDVETGEVVPPDGRPSRLGELGLCLFPHGSNPQGWRPDRLAVEALERFVEFIRQEREPVGLHALPLRIFVPPALVQQLRRGPGRVIVRQALLGGDLYVVAVVLDSEPLFAHEAVSHNWWQFLFREFEIPWIVLTSESSWSELAGGPEQLEATLLGHLSDEAHAHLSDHPWLLLLRRNPGGSGAELELACVHRPAGQAGPMFELEVTRATMADRLFHRADGAISNRDSLALETVVMVGLGSLGSSVALALARSGVRRFLLIDGDTLKIENISRHIGTVRELGCPKVQIVGNAILSVNPDAEVLVAAKWLTWDLPGFGAGPELEQICATRSCTIVSTCAIDTVDSQLNAFAVERGIPVIYAWALGAAEHGRVFRVLPGQTPCWRCVATAQEREPSRFPRFVLPGLGAEAPAPYVDPSLPGLGIDIAQIANITARYTLQTIAQVRGFELGYPEEPGDHLLWTNRGGWLFDRPLQLIVERFPRDPECVVCGSGRPSGTLDADEQRELEALITKLSPEVR